MEFELSPRTVELRDRIRAFMEEHVYPVEMEVLRAIASLQGWEART